MKKLVCLVFIFLFLFSACKKQSTSETTTEHKSETATLEPTELVKTQITDLTEPVNSSTQSATERKPDKDVAHGNENFSTEDIQNSSPMIIFVRLDELKEIKNAFDTMEADEFQTYMETEHVEICMTGMWNYENSTALLTELCSTYVPLLENDPDKLSEFQFYWERNDIYQLLRFDEEKRVSVLIDTVKSTDPKEIILGDEAVCVSSKTIEKDDCTVHLYEYENAGYHFFADILIDDTYIILRSFGIETMEDLEACFNRLSFVKIGDLLKE